MKPDFLEMNSEKVKHNRHQLLEGKFELGIRKTKFTVRSSNTGKKLPRNVEESPVLEKAKI